MQDSSQATMFLADQRIQSETADFRSAATIPAQQHSSSSLISWNDEVLAGGKKLERLTGMDSIQIILPVSGAILYEDSLGNSIMLDAGEALFIPVKQNAAVYFTNPYTDDLVNFLQGEIAATNFIPPDPVLISFDLDTYKDQLNLLRFPGVFLSIGKFTGRQDLCYQFHDKSKKLFVFIIEGAFEVQGRLLEYRDAMLLWSIDTPEFEALSNDAIILFLEC